ncbi:hypothetical protein [Streptomyces sp. CBMA123]|uniref:hypothetical protein n=1 Tax=Streptomyces sp. CBMA123 TaxID=1896313 RepID=UPI0016620C12|nr:hypothetical protein [Streptomyces sp. CBMA123]MBD0692609.1 hypothetical protein [Streptomyces sp. CBMA123]
MVVFARPPTWRRAARFTLLVPGVAIGVLVPFAVPGNAAGGDGDPSSYPVAQVLDGEKPLASAREVTGLCTTASACSFRMYDRAPREFMSAVLSVGNAAINCTDADMDIERTVTFVTSSTDNIGGEISGSATLEGGVDTTVTASASGNVKPGMTNSVNQNGPNKDKGPYTEDKVQNTVEFPVTVSGSNALHLGAKATFALAFQASFSRQWQVQSTETTKVAFSVSPGDEIQFGVVNATSRTTGELKVNGGGKLIKNVTVDSPSTVNVSSVVAQTFARPDKCLSLRPSSGSNPPPGGRSLGGGLIETEREPAGRVADAVYVRTAQGTWERR